MTDVVCLGILVADAIARPVDELPPRGALELVDEISLHGGGCALNTASYAGPARAGGGGRREGGSRSLRRFHPSAPRRAWGRPPRGFCRIGRADFCDGRPRGLAAVSGRSSIFRGQTASSCARGARRATRSSPGRALHVAGALVMPEFDGDPTVGGSRRGQSAWADHQPRHGLGRHGPLGATLPSLPYLDLFVPSLARRFCHFWPA